jgi:large subunit ribosomal protein L21
MFAIIKTGGKQYRVQAGDVLSVERLPAGTGKTALFDQVLLIADDQETLIGTPFIEKAAVRAAVIEDFKGEKVIVFKKKRRKQFRRTRGHRQDLTRVKILNIASDAALLPPLEIEEPRAKPEAAPAEAATIAEKVEAPETPKPVKKEAKPKGKPAAAKAEKEKKPAKPKKQAPTKTAPKKKSK